MLSDHPLAGIEAIIRVIQIAYLSDISLAYGYHHAFCPPLKAMPVGLFYTVGWWKQSQPVEVALTQGKNTLTFTRMSGRVVSFKEFFLATKKPAVPMPPANFTPVPSPPSPPSNAYIEVAAGTTCFKQGIQPVGEKDCGHACLALGFNYSGARSLANMSGCFVMTTATNPDAGCRYNTNVTATCEPPCMVDGDVTRALCERV
jgi:hypothetical protein